MADHNGAQVEPWVRGTHAVAPAVSARDPNGGSLTVDVRVLRARLRWLAPVARAMAAARGSEPITTVWMEPPCWIRIDLRAGQSGTVALEVPPADGANQWGRGGLGPGEVLLRVPAQGTVTSPSPEAVVDREQLDRWLVANRRARTVLFSWHDGLRVEAPTVAGATHDQSRGHDGQLYRVMPASPEPSRSDTDAHVGDWIHGAALVAEEVFRVPAAAIRRGVLRTSTAAAWAGHRGRRAHRVSPASFTGEPTRREAATVRTVVLSALAGRVVCETGGARRARDPLVRAESADGRIVGPFTNSYVCVDRAWLIPVLEGAGLGGNVRVLRAVPADTRSGRQPVVVVESEQLRAAVHALPWVLSRAAYRAHSIAQESSGAYPGSVLVRATVLADALQRLRAEALSFCVNSAYRIGRTVRWTHREDSTPRDEHLHGGAGVYRAIRLVLEARILPSGPHPGSRRWARTVRVDVPAELTGAVSPITIGWKTATQSIWTALGQIVKIDVATHASALLLSAVQRSGAPPGSIDVSVVIPLITRGVPEPMDVLNDKRHEPFATVEERQRMREKGRLDEEALERLAQDEARIAREAEKAAKSAGAAQRLEALRGKPVDI